MIGPGFADTLAAAQRGDEEAFRALWRDLQPPLGRFCRALAGPAGEDVAAETWLAALGGLARFRGDEPALRAWLFTIARRKVIDHARREHPERSRPLEEAPEERAPRAEEPEERLEEQLSTERALALVGRLPAEQAEVILLRVVAGLDVPEVARIVGKQPGAVRVAAHRGLRRLAEMLREPAVTEAGAVAFPTRDA